jgi:hypothetical protein
VREHHIRTVAATALSIGYLPFLIGPMDSGLLAAERVPGTIKLSALSSGKL